MSIFLIAALFLGFSLMVSLCLALGLGAAAARGDGQLDPERGPRGTRLAVIRASAPAVDPSRADGPPRRLRSLAGELAGEWVGRMVTDVWGGPIGTVRGAFLDPETDVTWLLIAQGRVRGASIMVPADQAVDADGQVWLPYASGQIASAPRAIGQPAGGDSAYRTHLYRHYRLAHVVGSHAPSAS